NVRVNHTFGTIQQTGQRGGRGGGGGFGGRGGGRGGRGRTTISFGINYSASDSTSNNPFPTIAGKSTNRGMNIPLSFSRSLGPFSTNTNLVYNRNHTTTANLFSNKQNIEAGLGITGVSTAPTDWGLPTLTFTDFTSLSDVRPSDRLNQVYSLSE